MLYKQLYRYIFNSVNRHTLLLISSDAPQCLYDDNHDFRYSYDLDLRPPGEVITRDTQCKLVFGENSTLCHVSLTVIILKLEFAEPIYILLCSLHSILPRPLIPMCSVLMSGAIIPPTPACVKPKRDWSRYQERAVETTRYVTNQSKFWKSLQIWIKGCV